MRERARARATQGPWWGYFKSQVQSGLLTFDDISPQKRTNGSKNEHGIPPRRTFCGQEGASLRNPPALRGGVVDSGLVGRTDFVPRGRDTGQEDVDKPFDSSTRRVTYPESYITTYTTYTKTNHLFQLAWFVPQVAGFWRAPVQFEGLKRVIQSLIKIMLCDKLHRQKVLN